MGENYLITVNRPNNGYYTLSSLTVVWELDFWLVLRRIERAKSVGHNRAVYKECIYKLVVV
jgi:hypothetical protein